MTTLYVSDLDGTLFNSKKRISDYSAQVLNKCIDKGMLFTVATARMPYGCDTRLAAIRLDNPGILTNGVFLYNFATQSYAGVEAMDRESVPAVREAFKKKGLSCFLYTFRNDKINIYFEDEAMRGQTQYYSDRALESCGEVLCVPDSLAKTENAQTFYAALTGSEADLRPVRDSLAEIPGIACALYLNIYNGLYCLEAFSAKASKKNALAKLKDILHYDELVVFGDNHNDISMIEVADRSYAPENALAEVKERVTAVLESSDDDGVAKFLAAEMNIVI